MMHTVTTLGPPRQSWRQPHVPSYLGTGFVGGICRSAEERNADKKGRQSPGGLAASHVTAAR